MFEREDWTLFRSVEGLSQRAGVPVARLRALVLKELADNAADASETIEVGTVGKGHNVFFVADSGPGLDGTPKQIAELFSIRRPMRSTKLLRLPQRGALGNGLRVVAGAVLASEGSLVVITRNQRIELQPQTDGTTKVLKVTKVRYPVGTRIEIGFGKELPPDPEPLAWVDTIRAMARHGHAYDGRSSPHWYDAAAFHELILACGSQRLRGLVAELDGCTGGKAGEIVAAARLDRIRCNDIDREQTTKLLQIARKQSRPVSPDRFRRLGRAAMPDCYYASRLGTVELGRSRPPAMIPFLVEVWASRTIGMPIDSDDDEIADDVGVTVLINRTPIISKVNAFRDKDGLNLDGSGLWHVCANAPKKGGYDILLNVATPFCPIISDGKAPDLDPFADAIIGGIEEAMRRAQRAAPKERRLTQKAVVLQHLDDAIAAASGGFQFNPRQLLYVLRPIVKEETGRDLKEGNFNDIITDFEAEHGEIPLMYREPRGSVYHPHTREDFPLGTLTVESYERPVWTFNRLLYIEKEGFSEALKADGWPERHDCALISSKGFSTRAARDLVDKLAEHDEPITVFCVHDADAPGSMIYQTLQEATKARGARKIQIVNLGLEAWEAVETDLPVEVVPRGDKHKPVADYVRRRSDGKYWETWLQTNRVELNAMTSPQFVAWLDRKMAEHGQSKLIPPDAVIADEFEQRLAALVRTDLIEQILREGRLDKRVADALLNIEQPSAAQLRAGIERLFQREPKRQWRDHVEAVATQRSKDIG
jgi:Topoisomerase 6 subunit A/Spo11, Toprim domain